MTSITDESTFQDDLITVTNEYYSQTNTFINNEITEQYFPIQSSTIKLNKKISSSFLNQSNIILILSLIILFCLTIILSSIIYGLWTIQGHYCFSWTIPYNYPIQFLSRRSIRSSTKSNNQIKTLSQLANEIVDEDFQQNYLDNFSSTSSQINSYF